jgi:hypothetical protein
VPALPIPTARSVQGLARWMPAEAVPFEEIQPGQFFIYCRNLYLKTTKVNAVRFNDEFKPEDWRTHWGHAQKEIIHRVLFYLPAELQVRPPLAPPLDPPGGTDCQTGL